MAEIYATISVIAFLLSVAVLAMAVVLFFTLDVRGVYAELYGKGKVNSIRGSGAGIGKSGGNSSPKSKKKMPIMQVTEPTELTIPDEPPTVAANGELVENSLVGVYEPGTDASEQQTENAAEELATEAMNELFQVTKSIVLAERGNAKIHISW